MGNSNSIIKMKQILENNPIQRDAFFIVDVLYKQISFIDIEVFTALTRTIDITHNEIKIDLLQASTPQFYDMLKIFERIDSKNFFEMKLGYVDMKGDVNGGFGFFLTKFDYELGQCIDQASNGLSQIILKFDYNKKRVLSKNEIDYDHTKKLPDIKKMLIKIKLDEI